MPSTWDFSLHKGAAGLAQLAPDWEQLAQTVGRHFLHFPAWYQAQMAASPSEQALFVAVHRQGLLQAVLPLVATSVSWGLFQVPMLQLYYPNEMGVNDIVSAVPVSDYWSALNRFLRTRLAKEGIRFDLIQWQCARVQGLLGSLPGYCHQSHFSKYLDIAAGPEAFWAGYSKKFLHDLSRKRRKLESLGLVRFESVQTLAALPAAYAAFLAIEDSGWKGKEGTSILKQAVKRTYYDALQAHFAANQQWRVNLLYLNDQVVAAQLGVQVRGTLYLLKIGYDESQGATSPGALLLASLVDHSPALGLTQISFVTGVNWIDRWKPALEPIGVIYTHTGRVRSRVLCQLANWRFRRKLASLAKPPSSEEDAAPASETPTSNVKIV
jgi:CelD/BcsL family acetyltransferase involved in cellulose biosynthesis